MNKEIENNIDKSQKFLKKKDFKNAEKILLNNLEISQNNFETFFLLGTISAINKKLDKAEIYLKKSILLNPSHANSILNLAVILKKKNKELANEKAKAIYQSFVERSDFAIYGAPNKTMEAIYKEFNQVAFLYTLGFNVSSAIVNLSQIPLFAVPYLGARYGVNNTIDAFTQASSVISGAKISVIEYYDKDFNLKESVKKDIQETAIDKADAKARIEYLESIIPIVREARQRGKLYSGDTLIELGVNEKSTSRDKLAHWSAFFFNGAERFNTQTTI